MGYAKMFLDLEWNTYVNILDYSIAGNYFNTNKVAYFNILLIWLST